MGTGIVVCGLNGAGKSTLGKALAKKLAIILSIMKISISQKMTVITHTLCNATATKSANCC